MWASACHMKPPAVSCIMETMAGRCCELSKGVSADGVCYVAHPPACLPSQTQPTLSKKDCESKLLEGLGGASAAAAGSAVIKRSAL